MKTITSTSQQVRMRKLVKNQDNSCPECGEISLGGLVRTECYGFMRLKERKTYPKTCIECGCEWELS